jgi:hypothetical protein
MSLASRRAKVWSVRVAQSRVRFDTGNKPEGPAASLERHSHDCIQLRVIAAIDVQL